MAAVALRAAGDLSGEVREEGAAVEVAGRLGNGQATGSRG